MDVQSLSIVVPGGCPNKCKFCVAHMHKEEYVNQVEQNMRFRRLYEEDYTNRLAFARDNGCNTVILTGDGEPLFNTDFLDNFARMNARLATPFRWIEIQTSGVHLDEEKLRWLRDYIKVSTISLSVSSIFSDGYNNEVLAHPTRFDVCVKYLCEQIKKYDFNLRISLNMTKDFAQYSMEDTFNRLAALGANLVTFRKLFAEGVTPEAQWVTENQLPSSEILSRSLWIAEHGKVVGRLPTGAVRYSVCGVSTVIDGNCMDRDGLSPAPDVMRYLILRPNAKLYTSWDDAGSILF